jgi:uncharacterized 2Fe-2S/4Fe-4S cluster protein (DUF4445 family)
MHLVQLDSLRLPCRTHLEAMTRSEPRTVCAEEKLTVLMPEILLLPSGRKISAVRGGTLMRSLVRGGIFLRSDCGGNGTCAKCLVHLIGNGDDCGQGALSSGREDVTSRHEVLACQTEISSDLVISIPLSSFGNAEVMAKPDVQPELYRLRQKAKPSAKGSGLGLAVDVGTTTIAVYVFDHERGEIVANGCVRNPQSLFGDDVMSRISATLLAGENLVLLRSLALHGINSTLETMAQQYGVETDGIREAAVVGNPTMIHLLLGVDPGSIGVYPYEPSFTSMPVLPASEVGLNVRPEVAVKVLPLVSGFIGSDVLAAAGAVALNEREPGTMLIDMGTNGEIMLQNDRGILATSCATGPVFEGATICWGMHAVSGAIDAVEIDAADDSVHISIIQHHPDSPKKAAGICGSGVISAVAAMLEARILEPNGRMSQARQHPNLRRGENGQTEFLLVPAERTETGDDIVLTQADIRSVQLAKAALMTGILALCRSSGTDCPGRILLGGAFGHFLNKRDAMRVGLLPVLPEERIELVGNAAGLGALLSLAEASFDRSIQEIAGRCRVMDLASYPHFQELFFASLPFTE